MDRRHVLFGTLFITILLLIIGSASLWNSCYYTSNVEGFNDREVPAPQGMKTRPCNIYYTKNIKLCDEGWYKKYDLQLLREKIRELQSKDPSTLTQEEKTELESLATINQDIDTLPIKQQCKLEMYGLSEATTHPYKINVDNDARKRGRPEHWAFCFEEPSLVNKAYIKDHASFKQVFQPTNMNVKFEDNITRKRYDMKSMYDDDLLKLYCHMYSGLEIKSGQNTSIFNGRDMMELSVDDNGKITSMRPVYLKDGAVYLHKPEEALLMYRRLFDIIRTPKQFLLKQRNYKPTIYKLLYHLCDAPANDNIAVDKMIEMIVPKTDPNIVDFFKLPEELLYDYSHYVDISDIIIEV